MYPHTNIVSSWLLSDTGEKSCIDRVLSVLLEGDGADLIKIGPALEDFMNTVLEEGGHALVGGGVEQLHDGGLGMDEAFNGVGGHQELVQGQPAPIAGVGTVVTAGAALQPKMGYLASREQTDNFERYAFPGSPRAPLELKPQ